MPTNHVTYITNTPADPQQQQQARKATPQALPHASRPRNDTMAPAATGDVTVTLSAAGRRAAATAETANAVKAAAANENAKANYVANNAVRQNQQQQTQKTINYIGGTA